MSTETIGTDEIEIYLQERIAKDLDLDKSAIPLDADLSDIGLNSVLISFIEGDLEEWLQMEIPPALLLQSSSIKNAVQSLIDLKNGKLLSAEG